MVRDLFFFVSDANWLCDHESVVQLLFVSERIGPDHVGFLCSVSMLLGLC